MSLSRTGLTFLLVVAVTLAGGHLQAEPQVIERVIRGGALPRGQQVIRVRQGDDVTLRWTADQVLVLHLHGYDIEAKVAPGTPATMRFHARAAGRFPIEVHAEKSGRESTLAYLEVHPR
jgi:hypothetical protein